MQKYKNKKQYRCKNYDYSQSGYYFVTICTKNREMFFGDVKNEEMKLSEIGLVAEKFWKETSVRFSIVNLNEYVVMPNHIHGIIEIGDDGRNAPRRVPTGIQPLIKNSLSSIINHFKGNVKKYCNKNNLEYFAWQPRFHDRIIRNDGELNRIREYIINNPRKWESDRNNQDNLFM
ncbi:MAG: transposase [Candidatus Moranbacteria bacterium CG23_combo_of_CG06-09_8_20_14_all_35_22]|nr:MAG: transposase [Candidatus Moranbacteria bacterium CG23_combo_of_CG06-09_8_20_14_all_35_22]